MRPYIPPGVVTLFELRLQAASKHSKETAWEDALKAIEQAELLTQRADFPQLPRNEVELRILLQRGVLERRQCNYKRATDIFRQALLHVNNDEVTSEHLKVLGELGTALLRQDAFAQASEIFEQQYTLAEAAAYKFDNPWEQHTVASRRLLAHACSAVGNRALALYQLAAPELDDPEKIDRAQLYSIVTLLEDWVERAMNLKEKYGGRFWAEVVIGENEASEFRNMTTTWQSTALDRLMLCHLALHDVGTALEYGQRSIAMSTQQPDPTVRALSRFYYGLALHHSGRTDEAIEIWQQTGKHGSCTAAIALSKDPTTENMEHLRILAKHGVRFNHHDEDGLSVLDYSFLSENERLKTVAIEGLRREFMQPGDNGLTLEMSRIEERIANLLVETRRRKKYRETFQLTLRPILNKLALDHQFTDLSYRQISGWTFTHAWLRSVLSVVSLPLGLSDDEVYLKGHAHRQEGIDSLRQGYLRQREMSSETRSLFDRLVMLRYRDFKDEMTRLPRPHSGDDMQEVTHLRRQYSALRDITDMRERDTQPEFLVFLSYRWLGKGSPDDRTNTQYQRMLDALDLYLRMHPWLDQDRISVWLDVVCIDQVDLEIKQRGINALPLVVAQCNALISIVDSEYLSRAWCSVEVLMMQTLRNSYGVHEHWNYDYKTGTLAEAETIPPINDDLDGLNLSYPEVDGPTVKFLVRQSRILAKTQTYLV